MLASAEEFAAPWPSPEDEPLADCPVCEGDGELHRRGYSHNPFCGFPTPDPQYDESMTCPTCQGDGSIPESELARISHESSGDA
jgi:DnaJ-class molecular chaperone